MAPTATAYAATAEPNQLDEYLSRIASVLIRLDDRSLIDGLLAHFRRSGFWIQSVGGLMVEVREGGEAVSDAQARDLVLTHLRSWQAANQDAQAELL
jgi:hypothetical protein